LNNPIIYTDPSGHTTTGEALDEWGYDAYSSGSPIQAFGWVFASAVWDLFGMESVSKIYDNVSTNRNDLTAWDVGGAVIDVGTLGKGGGIFAGALKYGGKALDWGKGLFKYSDDAVDLIADAQKRLPQDIKVNPNAPDPLPTNRPIGKSPTQNAAAQAKVEELKAAGYTDIRVNQQQVNAAGERVGINRPDIQATSPSGQRVYIEYDTSVSNRGPLHEQRLNANDPTGKVELYEVD
jgi:hypothetical protein